MNDAMIEPIDELTAERAIIQERMTANGYTQTQDFQPLIDAFALANTRRRCVLITGETGRGKTFAAKCAYPEARRIDMADRQSIALLESGAEFCLRNPLIMLDDVGSETTLNTYGVKSEVFGTFILAWYAVEPRPRLVITTNLPAGKMAERYGDRIMSRLNGCIESYKMTGHDMRRNESCGDDETPAVKKCLREFQGDVDEWGKDSLYPEAAFKFYAQRLTGADEWRALRRGITRIMAGHPGCTRQNDGPTIAEMMQNAVRETGQK